tara:strand:+ start:80 stop:559 length:480 start_codon:yes stop_codon:yes gene_type:complete
MKVQEFRPNKIDCEYLEDYTKIKLRSYYFGSGTKRMFNSKIMRVGLVDQDTEYSNLFSKYGSNPYDVVDLIFIIEKVRLGYTENTEYKIILIYKEKFYFYCDDPKSDPASTINDTKLFDDYQECKKTLTKLLKICNDRPDIYKDLLFKNKDFKFIHKGK